MATWKVLVDWNADGDYSDTYEDITADVQEINWRLGMHKPFQNVADEASCTVKVRNTDGKYNPENTSGVIYSNYKPKRRLKVTSTSGTVETTMYTGFVQDVKVDWQGGPAAGQTSAALNVVGLKYYLDKQEIDVGLLRDKTADEIIKRILLYAPVLYVTGSMWVLGNSTYSVLGNTTQLNSIATFTDLEAGVNTFENYGDTSNYRSKDRAADGDKQESAYKAITSVVEAERGRFFQARDGKSTFWNRYHLPLAQTVAGTVAADTGSYKPFGVNYGYATTFCNNIEVVPYQRAEGALVTLWELAGDLTVGPAAKFSFNADYSDENGAECGATYAKIGTLEYSGGTIVTGIKPLGKRAEITLENTDPYNAAVVSTLTVEGPQLTSNTRLIAYAENADSIGTYGKTPLLRLNLPALEDYETAQRIARYEVRRRSIPRGEVLSLTFKNGIEDDSNAHQISWGIGTRIQVTLPTLSHDEEYFIMGEDHNLSDGFKVHTTTYYLELADKNVLWVLGQSQLGVDTLLGI